MGDPASLGGESEEEFQTADEDHLSSDGGLKDPAKKHAEFIGFSNELCVDKNRRRRRGCRCRGN